MKICTSLLLALSGLSKVIAIPEDASATEAPCRARAWVRAPDLEPGQVVKGHVKVKLDGSCNDIRSYSLGLRFTERSWVKTRREDAKLPKRPIDIQSPHDPTPALLVSNDSVYEPGILGWRPWFGANQSAWEQYERDMKDPALWLVREEERIGFETKYLLRDGAAVSHDAIESFAILVPSTNYPPAFDVSFRLSIGDESDATDAEHIYTYFLDVRFANGTNSEIPAGYTTFNAETKAEPSISASETVNVTATRSRKCNDNPRRRDCPKEDPNPRDEFTLEVTFPHGRHFEQGSVNNITIVSHQLGPGTQRPLGFKGLDTLVKPKYKWAAKLAADNKSAEALLHALTMPAFQLRPTIDDHTILRHQADWGNIFGNLKYPKFAQDRVIENGTAFATEAVTTHFQVKHDCYPGFDMYYQEVEVVLEVGLELQNVSSADTLRLAGIEEYDWTPRPEEFYLSADVLVASIPIFVHRNLEEARLTTHAPTHYLSPQARAPTFVDPSSVTELLRKTAAARDDLAPIAQAKIIRHVDGNIVKNRYYGRDAWRGAPSAPHYVGDTWLRKVLEKGDSENVAG